MLIIILLGLLAAGGWLLGVIGFFRANSALAELRDLRRTLARPTSQSPAAAEPVPAPAAVGPEAPLSRPAVADQLPGSAAPAPPVGEPPPDAAPVADLEALLTMRWGVWIGSAALLLAGVFLVRYAVEQELLGPAMRCGLTALLGVALLAAAEWLLRHAGPDIAGPYRIDQAPAGLAAGAVAVLFGASYGAGPFYNLLSPLFAFGTLAAASFVGLAAALRYGPLTAAVGIAGAFATPALVAAETPSLPGLFGYLFVVSAAALLVVRRTAWTWLGWATTFAGAIWVCVAATPNGPGVWAAAAFVPAAAALNLLLLPAEALDRPTGRRLSWVPFATLGLAGLVLEFLAPDAAPRVGLFLLSPVAVCKGIADPRLDRLPWIAAGFGLLTLLCWGLPAWVPNGDAIVAVRPGAWPPPVVRPLITAAAGFAAFYAGAGLRQERRAPNPLHWAALVAAVPVLTLAAAYARIERFQTDMTWAAVALALTAALVAACGRAAAEPARQRAGLHAAGAVAALALGCAMLLEDHWLTLAIALFLPPLAWIEARAELPALRQVALAVTTLVLLRLTLNWYVLSYAFGSTPFANGLIAAYAVPAASFAVAGVMFRRRADDLVVATLEAGAVAFLACFIALEIRHWFGDGRFGGALSFSEIALHLLTISIQATAYLYLAQRTPRPMLDLAWRILGSIALACGTLLIAVNPAFTGAAAGIPALLAAYLVPAGLAMLARRRLSDPVQRRYLGAYAVVAGFAWITLQIRQWFHPDRLSLLDAPIEAAELWAWSGAWLAYGIALMLWGIRTGERLLRLAALVVIGLVSAKVFLVDMAGLTGLWRVLSFLGLGLALIGLSVVHRRFVLPSTPKYGKADGRTDDHHRQ